MTNETFDAIQSLLSAAAEDQQNYNQDGDPDSDYGDEWPEVARTKAHQYLVVAQWLDAEWRFGGTWDTLRLIEQLRGVAHSLNASAREYRNPEVGN